MGLAEICHGKNAAGAPGKSSGGRDWGCSRGLGGTRTRTVGAAGVRRVWWSALELVGGGWGTIDWAGVEVELGPEN